MGAAAERLDEYYELLEQAERVLVERRKTRWCPHKPTKKQGEFLALDAFEALPRGS